MAEGSRAIYLETSTGGSSLSTSVTIVNPLPAGSNTIGYVGLVGSLPPGNSQIGSVSITGSLPAGSNTIGNVTQSGHNTVLGTYNLTFAASAAAGTVVTASVPLPGTFQKDALYLVAINNPSGLGTAVTVTFQNGMKFGGSSVVYATVTSVNVASGAVVAYLVQGWLLGDAAAQISCTNSAAASSSGGTVQVEVVLV